MLTRTLVQFVSIALAFGSAVAVAGSSAVAAPVAAGQSPERVESASGDDTVPFETRVGFVVTPLDEGPISARRAGPTAERDTQLPVFAIGGITRDNVGDLAEVGRVAVGSALLAADDPARAARELRALLADE